jgi:predicted AAA+ superfamily ATPase
MRNWYYRYLEDQQESLFKKGKVFVLYGPRRVGKTELLKKFTNNFSDRFYFGTGDNLELRDILASQNLNRILSYFGNYSTVCIDEVQRITEIGYGLKLLVDHFPEMFILVSGSSSFDLSNKLGEPLTGRNITRLLYPISIYELHKQMGGMKTIEQLENLFKVQVNQVLFFF